MKNISLPFPLGCILLEDQLNEQFLACLRSCEPQAIRTFSRFLFEHEELGNSAYLIAVLNLHQKHFRCTDVVSEVLDEVLTAIDSRVGCDDFSALRFFLNLLHASRFCLTERFIERLRTIVDAGESEKLVSQNRRDCSRIVRLLK